MNTQTKGRSVDELLRSASASRISTFHNCRLKFYYQYVEGLSSEKSGARLIGSGVHEVLRKWNLARWRKLPGSTKANHDVTFDLGPMGTIVRGSEKEHASEVTINGVQIRGNPNTFAADRMLIVKALKLGLKNLAILDGFNPVVFSDDKRKLVIAPLRGDPAPTTSSAAPVQPPTETSSSEPPTINNESCGVDAVDFEDQQTVAAARRVAAAEAGRKIRQETEQFVADCVSSLREQTAILCDEMLQSIRTSETGVHQKTLNRLVRFIEQFKSMNFVDDQVMEQQLENVRRELLSRTAEEYRDSRAARQRLVQGLTGLSNHARELAQADASSLVQRFGQFGRRKFSLAA